MIEPSFETFKTNFEQGKTQLLWTTLPADLNTPVSAYLKLCGHEPYSFLLESVEGGDRLGRYSIIGCNPNLILKPDTLEELRAALKDCHIDTAPEHLPPMAVSGLFGYMGYDMIRHVEDIPDTNPDDLAIPESILIRPQLLAIFDNAKSTITLVTPVYEHKNKSHAQDESESEGKGESGDGDKAQSIETTAAAAAKDNAKNTYDKHTASLEMALCKINGEIIPNLLTAKSSLSTPLPVTSNITKDTYTASVTKAIDYIHQGEIFQTVLGQRFATDFDLPSFELYRALRQLNPSPFMFHVAFDGFSLVGSSPEILVRVRDNTVTIRPIAGTRPRGKNDAEDNALAQDLLNDEKECSEHLMLLDLGRNDVGRVAEFGSVTVTQQNQIEKYSHVMHIVSNVEGTLKADKDIIDALFSGFPAGTVSGAPKIRAMEIIDELETTKRSYYGGSVGYLSGNGEMDTCIALRTALIKDGTLYVQAGAGIVADSNPDSEHQECINKSQALFHAAEMAVQRSQE